MRKMLANDFMDARDTGITHYHSSNFIGMAILFFHRPGDVLHPPTSLRRLMNAGWL